MSQLPTLIADLALILICAGVMTLLFKKLKQPLVLGYVVAGFLASPHMPYTPSVMDTANIKTWADIGVIFLLFALGLEFSFKKIVKVGGSAIIAAYGIYLSRKHRRLYRSMRFHTFLSRIVAIWDGNDTVFPPPAKDNRCFAYEPVVPVPPLRRLRAGSIRSIILMGLIFLVNT